MIRILSPLGRILRVAALRVLKQSRPRHAARAVRTAHRRPSTLAQVRGQVAPQALGPAVRTRLGSERTRLGLVLRLQLAHHSLATAVFALRQAFRARRQVFGQRLARQLALVALRTRHRALAQPSYRFRYAGKWVFYGAVFAPLTPLGASTRDPLGPF